MPLGYIRLNEKKQRPNPNINFIKPLEGQRKNESQDFLSRVAAISAPIMEKNWISVNSLEEYEPNGEFWGRNFNAGEAVQLVLRSPSTGHWLPFRFVAMVFMHELAHCKVMAHNRAFWQVRNAYSSELMALFEKGYTGDGLWGKGQSLFDGQLAEQSLPAADGEMVRNLCGGAYRGVGGRRKRRTKAGKPQLTYAERKQKRIAKKFGTNGLTLGDDEDMRTKLENGKKIRGKPRVAQSNRGRELRAAALLDRLEQEKIEPVKTEQEDSDTDDNSDYEESLEGPEAVDASGQQILDSKGHRLVQVCEGEDHTHDLDAKREMEELLQVGHHQEPKRLMSQDPAPSIKQADTTCHVDSLNGWFNETENAIANPQESNQTVPHDSPGQERASSRPAISDANTGSSTRNTLRNVHSSHTEEQKAIEPTPNMTDELPNSCPICSLSNVEDALTCAACAHVLQPDKLPNQWRCMEAPCRESRYINAGDNGVCGICGVPKRV